jgi:hypothetical protein
MRETVRRTHAEVNYQTKIKLRWIELYGKSPINVTFPQTMKDAYISFNVVPQNEDSITVTRQIGESTKTYQLSKNDTIHINGEVITITSTPYYTSEWFNEDIKIEKLPLDVVTDRYRATVSIRQEEDEASILKLALKDNNPLRAQNILNTMIVVYNDITVADKNLMVENTTNFINGRLEVIEKDRDYKEVCRYAQMARTVILYRMSDEEYEELQASMKGHIAQARIQLKKDREFLKTVLARYFSMN